MPEGKFGYNEHLPESAREPFMWLCQEAVSLNVKWKLYQQFFSDPEVASLISKPGLRGTFQIIEEVLRHDMIMLVGRLRDSAFFREEENISFRSLVERLPDMPCLDRHVERFIFLCRDMERHRHKLVAHNDLTTRIDPDKSPLPGILKRQVDRTVKRVIQILNHVLNHYDRESEYVWDIPGGLVGADYLISLIKRAQQDRAKVLLGRDG